MKVVVQRVLKASCTVDNQITGSIDHGFMLLIGFTHTDNLDKVKAACKKIANLRIFDDEEGKMNKSLLDVNGSILAISQFTLYADARKGNRPSFIDSMRPDPANELYLQMVDILRKAGYGVTVMDVEGKEDNQYMLFVEINKKSYEHVHNLIKQVDKNAFTVANETKYVQNGYIKK